MDLFHLYISKLLDFIGFNILMHIIVTVKKTPKKITVVKVLLLNNVY